MANAAIVQTSPDSCVDVGAANVCTLLYFFKRFSFFGTVFFFPSVCLTGVMTECRPYFGGLRRPCPISQILLYHNLVVLK